MNDYAEFALVLSALLGADTAVRITSGSYMPLSVERIGSSGEGNPLLSIAHYGVQNGDLMSDPEMTFEVFPAVGPVPAYAEPLTYCNHYIGLSQEVYEYNDQGKRTHVRPKLKKDLKAFARLWFSNLRAQGFLGKDANRERLT